jgi:hypothetical protein
LPRERRLAPWVSAVLEDVLSFLGEVFLTPVLFTSPSVNMRGEWRSGLQITNHDKCLDFKGVYNMKARFLNIACLLGAMSVFTLAANAQSPVAKASVPFEFAAGGAMMAPGEYTIDVPVSGVLVLHGDAGNSVALLTVASDIPAPSAKAKLLFERRDGVAFLAGVEWPDRSVRLASPFIHVTKGAATAVLH